MNNYQGGHFSQVATESPNNGINLSQYFGNFSPTPWRLQVLDYQYWYIFFMYSMFWQFPVQLFTDFVIVYQTKDCVVSLFWSS